MPQFRGTLHYIGATQTLALGDPKNPTGPRGLHDKVSGDPINDATVTLEAAIDLDTGDPISGVGSLPLSMPYLAGSNGVYSAKIPDAAAVSEGQRVEYQIKAVKGTSVLPFFLLAVGAKKR